MNAHTLRCETPSNLYKTALVVSQEDREIRESFRAQARDAVRDADLPTYPFVVDHAELLIRRGFGMDATLSALRHALADVFVQEAS